jgi:hypothetical protein
MATSRPYAPRLHPDDVDRIGGDALARRSRFIESDVEAERLHERYMAAARRAHEASTSEAMATTKAARERAHRRCRAHETLLEQEWDTHGRMRRLYETALCHHEITDSPVAWLALDEDALVHLGAVLATDRREAEAIRRDLFPSTASLVTLVPVRKSAVARARRLHAEARAKATGRHAA